MTYAGVRVSKGRRSPPRNLRLLVDTGSDYTVLPAALLARLGVRPEFDEEVEIGNGDVIVRPVGRMHVRWRDRWAETFVAFGEPRDARVLGALMVKKSVPRRLGNAKTLWRVWRTPEPLVLVGVSRSGGT
jgi:predicted aspartyl protease